MNVRMRFILAALVLALVLSALAIAAGCSKSPTARHHPIDPQCDVNEPNDTCGLFTDWLYNHATDSEIALHPQRSHKLKISHNQGKAFTVKFTYLFGSCATKDPYPGHDPETVAAGQSYKPGVINSAAAGCHFKTIVNDGRGDSDPHIYVDPTP